MANGISHIVFDIGRVLITYDSEIPYRRLIPDADERRWFMENVCNHDWNLEQDRGRDWREAEDLLVARFPEHEPLIRAFRQNWHTMVESDIPGSVEILRSFIGQGRDVTMLTNFAADTFAEATERFSFLKEPRGVTVSALVRKIKPEPEIYSIHVDSFGLEPSETIFIDDNPDNVRAAIDCGWNAVLFRDPQTLRRDLEGYGLKA
jgi:2-haloacid dehalogenase